MSRTSTSSSSELLRAHCAAIAKEETVLREGGGKAGHERQRNLGRLPVRERISHLLDKGSPFFEIGLWAAYKMYEQWGKIPAAGVVAGIGNIAGVPCMIIGNDATVTVASRDCLLQLNAYEPVVAVAIMESQALFFKAVPLFAKNCIDGITANEKVLKHYLETTIGIVTALNPVLGYEKTTELAKEALQSGKGILELIREKKLLTEDQIKKLMDPAALTGQKQ